MSSYFEIALLPLRPLGLIPIFYSRGGRIFPTGRRGGERTSGQARPNEKDSNFDVSKREPIRAISHPGIKPTSQLGELAQSAEVELGIENGANGNLET